MVVVILGDRGLRFARFFRAWLPLNAGNVLPRIPVQVSGTEWPFSGGHFVLIFRCGLPLGHASYGRFF